MGLLGYGWAGNGCVQPRSHRRMQQRTWHFAIRKLLGMTNGQRVGWAR